MSARHLRVLVCWLALASSVLGADFWDLKAPEAWSDSEARRLLSHSPWAVPVTALTSNMSLSGRVGGLQGGRVGGSGGFGRPGGGGGVGGDGAGNLGGGSFLPSPERTRLTVRWASALLIRQAVTRRSTSVALGAASPTESTSDSDEGVYRIAVVGLPIALAVRTSDELVAVTTLRTKSGAARHPMAVRFDYENDLLTLEFAFSREEPFTVRDRDVEFRTEVGDARIKAAFRLDRMQLKGRLVL